MIYVIVEVEKSTKIAGSVLYKYNKTGREESKKVVRELYFKGRDYLYRLLNSDYFCNIIIINK